MFVEGSWTLTQANGGLWSAHGSSWKLTQARGGLAERLWKLAKAQRGSWMLTEACGGSWRLVEAHGRPESRHQHPGNGPPLVDVHAFGLKTNAFLNISLILEGASSEAGNRHPGKGPPLFDFSWFC